MTPDRFSKGLEKNPANHVALTPLSFLYRTAQVYPDRTAVVHGRYRSTWAETYARCRRLASALRGRGIGSGDVVAVMAPNVPAMYEAHFGVAMAGAVLNALNTRLDAAAIAFMLKHADAQVLITDGELADVVEQGLALLDKRPLVVDVDDPEFPGGRRIGNITYEELLEEGTPDFPRTYPDDEWDALSLNYTSGTTGDPKGVVYHHRGAYLNAISNAIAWGLPRHAAYLWTLPMFHCNGWCFPWAVAAFAGVNVCLRRVEADAVFEAVRNEGVTHLCGAPIVFGLLANAPAAARAGIDHRIYGLVAGAAPAPALIASAESAGIELTHVYGLTEVYGPAAICEPRPEWRDLPLEQRADYLSRQGVTAPLQESMSVLDPESLEPVPWDGATMGEIMFRGNITMKGYLENPTATAKAFASGWFRTGDLAVVYPDGYLKIRDRSKDIIISGGENISSLEVEEVLYRHPAVLLAAVVSQPDEKWGETPCAFVELKEGAEASEQEVISFCRAHLAHFKAPKRIVFGPLPRTSTGKVQKFVLRRRACVPG